MQENESRSGTTTLQRPLPSTQSTSQPAPSSRTFFKDPSFHALSYPSTPKVDFETRAQRSRAFESLRLQKSKRLDKFFIMIRGQCPIDFVIGGKLTSRQELRTCKLNGERFPLSDYRDFKKRFVFPPYTYCWNCAAPQDHHGNAEAPECHWGFKFGKGLSCDWNDFPFVAVFCMWYTAAIQLQLKEAFQLPSTMSFDSFVTWLMTEDVAAGEYIKLIEVFLWFCERWLESS